MGAMGMKWNDNIEVNINLNTGNNNTDTNSRKKTAMTMVKTVGKDAKGHLRLCILIHLCLIYIILSLKPAICTDRNENNMKRHVPALSYDIFSKAFYR